MRPERRTALVTKELQRLNIDIAALSETRLSEEDQITEESSGYTIFWKGKPNGVRRDGGVGFAVKTSMVDQIEQPTAISDRLMKLRIPLSCGRFVSILSVYAPTLQASDIDLNSFYESLSETVRAIPCDEKVIILGDFNARVGKEHDTWTPLGPHGVGKVNGNGIRLLELCSELDLAITNTFFRQKEKHKVTWFHPRSKHGHLLDYIITRRRDISDACNVKVLRSADCDTDHKLVRGKFKLRIRKKIRLNGVKAPKRLNVSKLSDSIVRRQLSQRLDEANLEESWDTFKECMYTVGSEVLGHVVRKHRDWFDDNDASVTELLAEKHRLHQSLLSCSPTEKAAAERSFKNHKQLLQRELRTMKNQWWKNISKEVQTASDCNDSRQLHSLLRTAFGPKSSSTAPLKSADGNVIFKDPVGISNRWSEHFTNLFYNPSVVDFEVIDNLRQVDLKHNMDDVPTLEEVNKSIMSINKGKAPGFDGLPAELLAYGGVNVAKAIHKFIKQSWEGTPIPQDWIDGILVSIFKGKGLKSVCDNYRGITLLESVGKVLARLLLNRLLDNICPHAIPESQCGFRSGRGTNDMIFSVRQLQEKCIEQHMPLYQVFVDLTKAFDTVNRDALWKVLAKLGCPPNFVRMISELHRNMKARFTFNGTLSDEISIDNGVKQGDILAPTLFSIYFSALLSYAFSDCDSGVYIKFRTTRKLFNLRRFEAKTKVCDALVRELLYADDADFVAHSETEMQLMMDRFSHACDAFGLTISIKKTKVMYTPPPGDPYIEPSIFVNGNRLDVVDTFVYLGSTVSRDVSLDAEILSRIQKASVAFGKLDARAWSDRDLTIATKIDVYNSVVLMSLINSSETWTLHRRHLKLLERFHQNCLRRVVNVKWQSMTPDTKILELANSRSIEAMIFEIQMRWTGHVVRMDDSRLPKRLLYGVLKDGKRPWKHPRKRYKDCVKDYCKVLDLGENWEKETMDRDSWRMLVKTGVKQFETERIENEVFKRSLRKDVNPDLPEDVQLWSCNHCPRMLKSKAGLTNHLKSHETSNLPALPARPDQNTCVICNKVCKSSAGLKSHMHVHKDVIPQASSINPVKVMSFVCHVCFRPCKSASGLKSHLRAHARSQNV